MKIDNILLDKLTAQAKESPRLRMNLDLRNSAEDSSQRMLNAIEPGSVVPIHRHQKTSETVVCCVDVWWRSIMMTRECWSSLLCWEIATSLTLLAMTCL